MYRSESAKLFVFLQMSQEIMQIDESGNTCYEKAMTGYFPELFRRWQGTNHVVSPYWQNIIIFC